MQLSAAAVTPPAAARGTPRATAWRSLFAGRYAARRHVRVKMRTLPFADFIVVAILCLLISNADARTWHVKPDGSGDAPNVQAGIDSAAAADTVVLACGTFYEHGLVMKSNVSLIGETAYPPCVTIDAQHQGRLMTCALTGGSTLIEGIRFTNASPQGILIYGYVTARNCIFANNDRSTIDVHYSAPEFYNCIFYGNGFSDPTPGECIFGVYAGTDPLIKNCTFVDNYGVLNLGMDATARVESCIIAYCVYSLAKVDESWFSTISCTDFYANEYPANDSTYVNLSPSCFMADPQFCGVRGTNNFYLQSDSPCAPGNHPKGIDCGVIGALGVTCGEVETEHKTWGNIKSFYRRDD
jgi:hypothetical protein